MSDQEQG